MKTRYDAYKKFVYTFIEDSNSNIAFVKFAIYKNRLPADFVNSYSIGIYCAVKHIFLLYIVYSFSCDDSSSEDFLNILCNKKRNNERKKRKSFNTLSDIFCF